MSVALVIFVPLAKGIWDADPEALGSGERERPWMQRHLAASQGLLGDSQKLPGGVSGALFWVVCMTPLEDSERPLGVSTS